LELVVRLKEAKQKAIKLAMEQDILRSRPASCFPIGSRSGGCWLLHSPPEDVIKVACLMHLDSTYFNYLYVFVFKIGNKNMEYTCWFTGVNGNTLLGWMTKPHLIDCWDNIGESMRARGKG
jgi:hypothetical protein